METVPPSKNVHDWHESSVVCAGHIIFDLGKICAHIWPALQILLHRHYWVHILQAIQCRETLGTGRRDAEDGTLNKDELFEIRVVPEHFRPTFISCSRNMARS